MFEIIGTLFTSIVSGGATGLFGVAIQRYFDLKNKSIELEFEVKKFGHEIDMKNIDLQIMQKESEAKVQVAEVNAQAAESVADAQAFAASFKEPQSFGQDHSVTKNQGWAIITLELIRGLVRPGLTIYLIVLTTLVYFHAETFLRSEGVVMDVSHAMKLTELVVGTILYLTTTCVLWWFGTRNKQKPPKIRS